MSDSREVIRQQMDATKSDLAEKLQLLKLQIAETAQSTGSAVNATVTAAQDTMETVQSAAKSVRNALNVRRRISMHPWLILGACAGLGYLAGRRRRFRRMPSAGAVPSQLLNPAGAVAATSSADTSAMASAIAAAYQKGMRSSSWDLLRTTALTAAIEIVQDIAFRVVPKLLDRLTAPPVETRSDGLNEPRPDEYGMSEHQPTKTGTATELNSPQTHHEAH